MSEQTQAAYSIQQENSEMNAEIEGNREHVITMLESVANILRQDLEHDRFAENVDNAVKNAENLASVVNDSLYWCDGCGRPFPTQNGYAGHQNHCEGD